MKSIAGALFLVLSGFIFLIISLKSDDPIYSELMNALFLVYMVLANKYSYQGIADK